jgi:cytochrome c oxidase cbb3-type subunit 3
VADNKKDVDVLSGVETTGHEWDGIKELDNPMPRWWLWTFYATIIWSIGYWVLMPAWPLISDYTRGFLGYSQRQVVTKDLQKAAADRAAQAGGLVTASLEEINNTPEMFAFAMAAGQADIHQTVQYGIRDPHPDTRISQMPAFLKDEMLTRTEVDNVVEYVLALSGQDHDKARAAAGAAVFADNCAVCHGNEGKGDRVQGAPDLTDAIWLYGGDRAAIRETVANSRYGIMPAWVGRLDPVTIKSLAVYVHALGGGE